MTSRPRPIPPLGTDAQRRRYLERLRRKCRRLVQLARKLQSTAKEKRRAHQL